MASVNKVTLVGHLGGDPEVKSTSTGKSVANFSLATTEGSGDTKKTQWHKIILWEKLADLAGKWLSKGDLVYIDGKVTYRSYEQEGITKYITEIVAFSIQFLKLKKSTNTQNNEGAAFAGGNDDDMPF